MENKDYILRRDHLLKIMHKQNILISKEIEDTTTKVYSKRGRKPAPSKRIESKVNTKTYSPKRFKNKFG